MTVAAAPHPPTSSPAGSPTSHRTRLFLISTLALSCAGISASLRSGIAAYLKSGYLDHIDAAHAGAMLGGILGIAFLGFAFTIAIGSALLDLLGMRILLLLSSLCFITGTTVVLFVDQLEHTFAVYSILWTGMLLTGIGWGLVECVINPLVASLYTTDKTSKLNLLHAWWPFGLIIGGLIGYALSTIADPAAHWKSAYALVLLPSAAFGVLVLSTRFPPTERVVSGVSTAAMFRELGRPMFVVWFLCMFLTAATELAPGQWVDFALSATVHMQGILLLVFISAIMFVMRHFAGAFAHRLSPVGLLWCSSLLAGIGLFALGHASSPTTALLAATLWGSGVCYMWPTMLGSASERFPRGGALLMGLMGTAGTLSIAFFLPKMGAINDAVCDALAAGREPANPSVLLFQAMFDGLRNMGASIGLPWSPAAGGDATAYQALVDAAANHDAAATASLAHIQARAASTSFESLAILPVVLLVVFGLIWISDRMRGGYRPERLVADPPASRT
jgi:MFS family permease